jgi:hypothetical protein
VDQRERCVLVEIGRYYRSRILREYGDLSYDPLKIALQEGIQSGAAFAGIDASSTELANIAAECALEYPLPSALAGFLEAFERLAINRESERTAAGRSQTQLFQIVSLADVVNHSDLLVTVRMPRNAWDQLSQMAGRKALPQPKPRQGLFSSALDFSGKKRA